MIKVSSILRWSSFRHALAFFGLLVLVVVTTLWWRERSQRFPRPLPGSYLGSVSGVLGEDESEVAEFYLEVPGARDDVLVAFLREGWDLQRIPQVSRSNSAGDGWLQPLTISGPEGPLVLLGNRIGPLRYAGVARNEESGLEGRWELTALRREPETTPAQEEILRLWLLLRHELEGVQSQISEVESLVPEQRAEIDKLTDILAEGETLRTRADRKFKEVRTELDDAERVLEELRAEAAKLANKVELAQRLTQKGKLLELARKTVEREHRWVDSMLRSAVTDDSPEFKAAWARAKRIRELKDKIRFERKKLYSGGVESSVSIEVPKIEIAPTLETAEG